MVMAAVATIAAAVTMMPVAAMVVTALTAAMAKPTLKSGEVDIKWIRAPSNVA